MNHLPRLVTKPEIMKFIVWIHMQIEMNLNLSVDR